MIKLSTRLPKGFLSTTFKKTSNPHHRSLISTLRKFTSSPTNERKFHNNLISPLRSSNNNKLHNFGDADENGAENDKVRNKKRIGELNDLLEFNPNFTDALIERSKCYEGLSEWKLASADLEKVLEIEPNRDDIVSHLEQLYWFYIQKENYNVKLANNYLERAFEIVSNNAVQVPFSYYRSLYSICYELEQFEKAISYATKGIKSIESTGPIEIGSKEADDLAALLCRRGSVLITKFKMIERGRQDLERALSLASSKYEPLVLMLDSFKYLKNHDLVMETYNLVKELEKKETRTDEKTLLEYQRVWLGFRVDLFGLFKRLLSEDSYH
ncbi:predicted protein [Naegleria gruberi]|uniref:Predicted protein n=1 Tax=Naegleria gruberi TaxID=5762 RepID=D2VVW4_NAEGR|nr:uncharacterized protein NAEGRDRAFT_73163 [Naegleria gruberi]EFC39113.1 predicted protein [Naegleria gruberi]|eukprot:XP_002671857.1 predicted protein [Naegleria gruberi strain NEG-M]